MLYKQKGSCSLFLTLFFRLFFLFCFAIAGCSSRSTHLESQIPNDPNPDSPALPPIEDGSDSPAPPQDPSHPPSPLPPSPPLPAIQITWAKAPTIQGMGISGVQTAFDDAGNRVIAGSFLGTLDFNGTSLASAPLDQDDLFVLKLDPAGTILWAKRLGEQFPEELTSLATDAAGNIFLTGSFFGNTDLGCGTITAGGNADVFLAKLNPNGDCIWSHGFGDDNDQTVARMTIDSASNPWIIGSFFGVINFGTTNIGATTDATNVFLANFDPNGISTLTKSFGDEDLIGQPLPIGGQSGFFKSQVGRLIVSNQEGGVFITGSFYGGIDFGGGVLIDTTGNQLDFLNLAQDSFIVKLDPNGAFVWNQRISCSTLDCASILDIATDVSGNLIASGSFKGTVDFGNGPKSSEAGFDGFTAKWNKDGDLLWVQIFGGSGNEAIPSLSADETEDLWIAGTKEEGALSLQKFSFLAKLSKDGILSSMHETVGPLNANSDSFAILPSVKVLPNDHVLLSGFFQGTLDFGQGLAVFNGGPIGSIWNWNMFLIDLIP